MASERVTVALPADIEARFNGFREDFDISKSEALRRALDRGLAAYGYDESNGDKRTRLQRYARESAKACLVGAAFSVAFATIYTFAVATFVAPLLFIAAICMTIVYYEPDFSLRMGWK